jgi:hypothetical protein
MNQITLQRYPGLLYLVADENDEKKPEPNDKKESTQWWKTMFRRFTKKKFSPEAILQDWINYHLKKAGSARFCFDLTTDLCDSEIYSCLLKKILPPNIGVKSPIEVLKEKDLEKRAEIMLQQAEKLCSQNFVTREDVMNGIVKLKLLFLANLFIKHHGLVLGAQDQENVLGRLSNYVYFLVQ